ncbi:MAG: copper amine oxidase [Peptococcaceae bacterium BICA1-7]|nr:MAG: copper amine oxidase [Peptococcaceae bacterium BICA1-7]HBV98375.1 copper amine oxidase N-terminal domain-containing protein [Desulfotomaculum sp.]
MKQFWGTLALIFFFLFFTTDKAFSNPNDSQNYSPAHARVLVNGKQLATVQEPILVKDIILVPLRDIAETLGATVTWNYGPPLVTVKKGDKSIGLNIDSETGFTDRATGKIFFLDQPPILVNGKTMVSLRFMSEALEAKVSWDEKSRTIHISDGKNFMKLDQPEEPPYWKDQSSKQDDSYYKFYQMVVGPGGGPTSEEAKVYALEQGLLKTVKDVQRFIPTRFSEFGPTDTMVTGNDESGREKALWLVQNHYNGKISLDGSVFLDDGISKEIVYSKLENKGISRENVKKIYIAPYNNNQINWFVLAEQGNKKYYYCFDYITGDVVIENIL